LKGLSFRCFVLNYVKFQTKYGLLTKDLKALNQSC